MTGDEAYRRFLAKSMSYDDWLVQEDTYSNPGLMKTLKLLASQTVESVRTKPDDGVRIMLISEEVGDVIDLEVAATNPECKTSFDAVRSKNESKVRTIQEENPDFVQKEHAAWWAQGITKANIEIPDRRFSAAKDRLIQTPTGTSDK
jgi:hypothetical protein